MPTANITRRFFLRSVPLAITVGTVVAAPVVSEASEELPVIRVNRIAKELSKAMDDWMEDLAFPGDPPTVMKAHVCPASYFQYPVMFEDIDRHRDGPKKTRYEQAMWHMNELKRLIHEDGAPTAPIIVMGCGYSDGENIRCIHSHPHIHMDEDGLFRSEA